MFLERVLIVWYKLSIGRSVPNLVNLIMLDRKKMSIPKTWKLMRKPEHKIIALSVLAGLGFWVLDAVGDKFFKYTDEPFLKVLIFDAATHEFLTRPLVLLGFIIFGVVTARYMFRARESEGRYQQFFDSINDGAFVMPFRGPGRAEKFTDVNVAACQQLGYRREELLRLTPLEVVAPGEQTRALELHDQVGEKKSLLFEVTALRKDGSVLPVEINAHLLELEGQTRILGIIRDLTARKAREVEIRRLASFPQLNPNPILEVNAAGEITFYNAATSKCLENLGVQDPRIFLPNDLEQILAEGRKGICEFQRERIIKGRLFSELIYFAPKFEVLRIYPKDITERRKGEEALRASEQQLRVLTSQLLQAQEAERLRISRELHDELGQALMFTKFQLSQLQDRLRRDQQGLKKDCGTLLAYLDGVIENVRRLSRDLSPTVLDELGLTSALRYLLGEFCRLHGIEGTADLDDLDPLFSAVIQLNIYRVFQECLTNVGRHAQATHLAVEVKKQDGQVLFVVQDDGKGFDPDGVRTRKASDRGIGLATIAERVQALGGSIEVQSRDGAGTRVTFTVPVEAGNYEEVSVSNSLSR